MDVHSAIDLSAVVTTPENIRFEYRIAGPFRRLPALLLDFLIRCAIVFAAVIVMIAIGMSIRVSSGLFGLAFLILLFVLDWFYGLFFETYWNGQTPGKWLTQIRVISVDGRPINAYQSTVRNFLRLADFAPMVSLEMISPDAPPAYVIPTFLVALICMVATSRFQRLGDLAAGTMVVVNERSWVPTNVKLEDPRIASLSEYIPANFRMNATLARAIALYAERRSRIPHARRLELAMHLAKPLLNRFQLWEDTSPDLLLCALYYREFVRKEAFTKERLVADSRPEISAQVLNGLSVAQTDSDEANNIAYSKANDSTIDNAIDESSMSVAIPPILDAMVVDSETTTPNEPSRP